MFFQVTLGQVDHQDSQAHRASLASEDKVHLDLRDLQVLLAHQVKFTWIVPSGYFWHITCRHLRSHWTDKEKQQVCLLDWLSCQLSGQNLVCHVYYQITFSPAVCIMERGLRGVKACFGEDLESLSRDSRKCCAQAVVKSLWNTVQ